MKGIEVLETLQKSNFVEFVSRIEQIYDYIAFNCEKESNEKLLKELNSLINALDEVSQTLNTELDKKVKPFSKRGIIGLEL